jgi:heat shock protein HslJ
MLGVVLLTTTLGGCGSLVIDGQNIAGTTWRAVSVAGQSPVPGSEPTITFDGDRMRVFGGCSSRVSDTPAQVQDGRLIVPEMLDPLMNCLADGGRSESPVMPIEHVFMAVLTQNRHIELQQDELRISGGPGEIVLVRR